MPVYNEAATVEEVIRKVLEQPYTLSLFTFPLGYPALPPGRLATYRYYNMDQVVGMALTEFEKLRERYEGRKV